MAQRRWRWLGDPEEEATQLQYNGSSRMGRRGSDATISNT
jgi:hypothetical protein